MPKWRARSASDKTDDWLSWYLTDDNPPDYNKTLDAIEVFTGKRPIGLPFLSREAAEDLASFLNGEANDQL